MKWTEPKPPTIGINHYDHVILTTPIGEYVIEWKSWKEQPSYDVNLDCEWIGCEYDLKSAKDIAENHLLELANKLNGFIKDSK